MSESNIDKLRRFALIFGILLLFYSFGGIEYDPSTHFQNWPFKIHRCVIEIVLVGGTLIGLLRYWYYSMVLNPSPRKIRRLLLDGYSPRGDPYIIEKPYSRNREDESLLARLFGDENPGLGTREVVERIGVLCRDSSGSTASQRA